MFPIGICGDNCSYCPRYVSTQNGNAYGLDKIKELWVRLGLRDPTFAAQDLSCLGCRPENNCAYSELRACAIDKGIDNCGLCNGYPCKLINASFEKSETLRSHAARVCKAGEMNMLCKAFFSKQENLDQIHWEMNKGKRK